MFRVLSYKQLLVSSFIMLAGQWCTKVDGIVSQQSTSEISYFTLHILALYNLRVPKKRIAIFIQNITCEYFSVSGGEMSGMLTRGSTWKKEVRACLWARKSKNVRNPLVWKRFFIYNIARMSYTRSSSQFSPFSLRGGRLWGSPLQRNLIWIYSNSSHLLPQGWVSLAKMSINLPKVVYCVYSGSFLPDAGPCMRKHPHSELIQIRHPLPPKSPRKSLPYFNLSKLTRISELCFLMPTRETPFLLGQKLVSTGSLLGIGMLYFSLMPSRWCFFRLPSQRGMSRLEGEIRITLYNFISYTVPPFFV